MPTDPLVLVSLGAALVLLLALVAALTGLRAARAALAALRADLDTGRREVEDPGRTAFAPLGLSADGGL